MRFEEFNQLNEAADRVKWLVRRKAQVHGAGTTHAVTTLPAKVEGWFYSEEEALAKLHQLEQAAEIKFQKNKDIGLPREEFEIEKTDLYGTPIREDEIAEVAPPGMEDWIKDRKADFKKRYGDKWESVLYATAWKRHKNESIKESHGEDSPVANAIIRRIMMQHPDLLQKYGPEKIMQAVDDQVAWVGDVEEIGTSDVSIWVKDVERSLQDMNPEHYGVDEAALDPSGLIAAAQMVQDYIVTAEVDGKVKKFRVRGMTGPNAAKERFLKHHSMAKVLDVKPEQGVAEMDKSAPQPGRDGKISHSTYGSRDKKGSDYFKGKEAPGKPITKKQMEKDALDILKKQGVAEGSEEKEEFKPWGTLKKPQPYHDPDWMKKIPQKELDSLAGRNKKTKNKDMAEGARPDDKFDGHEQAEWDEKMARLKKLAGQGELKTVWDPVKRVYKNVPVNQDKE